MLFVVAVAAPLAWSNRSYLDSFIDNKIGAPDSEQTTAFLKPDVAVVVRLAVAGDVGTGGAAEYQTVAVMDAVETQRAIVIMHHPAYSAGWHGDEPSVQEHFVPLFEDYKVDLVLSGHDHDYQRSKDIDGVTYIVTGAAAKLRPAGSNRFTEVAWSTHSFVDLAVYSDRIQGQAIDHQSQVIDTFTIAAR